MRRKIPNTTALSIFEAAARHGSFARAAKELCLTESAISRQIAALEGYLDTRLFARIKKQVVLNDAGQAYLKNISKNLADIEMHTLALMANKGDEGVLELAVIPTFANRWLLPRLQGFRKKHPNIMLNLTEKAQPFIFRDTIFDAALHFDHPAWAEVVKVDLFEERLVPVISPNHFDTSALTSPRSLLSVPLLHKWSRPKAWQHWFELAGCPDSSTTLGMHFDMYGMVIEAARAGLGAGLVPRFYVNHEIHRNDLIAPFDLELKHEKRYCLVYPEHKQDSPLVVAFRDWVAEIGQEFSHGKSAANSPPPGTGR